MKRKEFLSGLSQLAHLVEKTEKAKEKLERARVDLLSEDTFYEEDSEKVYKVARDYDVVATEYIKLLEKKLDELMKLSSDIILGSDVNLNKVLNK